MPGGPVNQDDLAPSTIGLVTKLKEDDRICLCTIRWCWGTSFILFVNKLDTEGTPAPGPSIFPSLGPALAPGSQLSRSHSRPSFAKTSALLRALCAERALAVVRLSSDTNKTPGGCFWQRCRYRDSVLSPQEASGAGAFKRHADSHACCGSLPLQLLPKNLLKIHRNVGARLMNRANMSPSSDSPTQKTPPTLNT